MADIPLPGGPTRFDYQSLEPATGRLFISHMDAGQLVVFDTRAGRVIANLDGFPRVTGVLAFDPSLQRLYVAAESGVVAVFEKRHDALVQLGWYRAPHAHSVAVDPGTHRIYLPLANVNAHPVLRVMEPNDAHQRRRAMGKRYSGMRMEGM